MGVVNKATVIVMIANFLALAGLALYFTDRILEDKRIENTPAEEFIKIDYIEASDVYDGNQDLTMCRWVDQDRAAHWIWELVHTEEGRKWSAGQDAVTEVVPDCLYSWSLDGSPALMHQKPGAYYWQTLVEFEVDGVSEAHKKTTGTTSNIFTIY